MNRFKPFLKPVLHPEFINYLQGKTIMPINIEISLTGRCNANCPWCFYRNEKNTTSINTEKFINFLNQLKPLGIKAITWTGGGEPTLHPDFNTFVNIIAKLGIDQGLITNGVYVPMNFDPEKFNWIRVSKSNMELNKENLKILRRCKVLGFAINYNGNYNEINDVITIGEEIGVNYIQVRPVLNTKGKTIDVKINRKKIKETPLLIISDYKFKDSKIPHTYNKCEAFHFVPFIWENGDVDVCGYMKNEPGYRLGNIYKQPFETIMKTAPKTVQVSNKCQICCKNHELNKLINKLKDIEDKNFI